MPAFGEDLSTTRQHIRVRAKKAHEGAPPEGRAQSSGLAAAVLDRGGSHARSLQIEIILGPSRFEPPSPELFEAILFPVKVTVYEQFSKMLRDKSL
jgi:hypothetical protein